ncbi:hypothetical protein ScPMuIL_018410 [Solemya velum]
MLKIVLIAVICVVVQGQTTDSTSCQSDSDCGSGLCCDSGFTHECHAHRLINQPCHLPGHDMNLFKCGCAQGMNCTVITLPHTHNSLTTVEEMLRSHGWGVCLPPGTVFG